VSFAAQTKKELTQVEAKECCQKAELAAIIRMNGTLRLADHRRSLDITTENAAIARRIYTLIKSQFGVHAEVLVRKKMRLKKNNVYMVRVPFQVEDILRQLHIADAAGDITNGIPDPLLQKMCCRRSFLRGAFLAGGSVNDPESASYHLELMFVDEDTSKDFVTLLNRFHLHAKHITRKSGHVAYLKEGEKIIRFLSIIGAHHALLRFEDVRIVKGMRNQVNRLVNCETANLNKTINAAVRQLENIQLLIDTVGLANLPPRLREVAEMRLQHPEINLKELGNMLTDRVSKSGVNHRLHKLDEWAERIRRGMS